MLLVDQDVVDDFNPVRQAYPIRAIGQKKADALAELLAAQQAETVAVPNALTDEQQVKEIARRNDISAALVVTGTSGDFAIARGLRAAGVPHVVGRCYPRARYWEGIVTDRDLPSF